jgi:ribosomal protein S14
MKVNRVEAAVGQTAVSAFRGGVGRQVYREIAGDGRIPGSRP